MNSSAPLMMLAARSRRVHHHVVGEDLAHPVPVLGVQTAEVAGLELPDRLDVVHVLSSVISLSEREGPPVWEALGSASFE